LAVTLGFEKLLKLACLYEIFALNDCAAELILHLRATLAAHVEPERLLDLLTPLIRRVSHSYADYVNLFRSDVTRFFPQPPAPPPPAPPPSPEVRPPRTVASILRAVARRVRRAPAALMKKAG
jgi:hypothetical protein